MTSTDSPRRKGISRSVMMPSSSRIVSVRCACMPSRVIPLRFSSKREGKSEPWPPDECGKGGMPNIQQGMSNRPGPEPSSEALCGVTISLSPTLRVSAGSGLRPQVSGLCVFFPCPTKTDARRGVVDSSTAAEAAVPVAPVVEAHPFRIRAGGAQASLPKPVRNCDEIVTILP